MGGTRRRRGVSERGHAAAGNQVSGTGVGARGEQGGDAAPGAQGFEGTVPERYRLAEEEHGALKINPVNEMKKM